MPVPGFHFLALGDSYTIGEQVPLTESFPYQLVQQMRGSGYSACAPEILARTGWTSGELLSAMDDYRFLTQYDFVTLLIGVNNQYRGLPVGEYSREFGFLIRKAIRLANNLPDRVAVLSIPDWGQTPFAANHNRDRITSEIETYNEINRGHALEHSALYVSITHLTREAAQHPENLTADGLHYTGTFYRQWARELYMNLKGKLKQ